MFDILSVKEQTNKQNSININRCILYLQIAFWNMACIYFNINGQEYCEKEATNLKMKADGPVRFAYTKLLLEFLKMCMKNFFNVAVAE